MAISHIKSNTIADWTGTVTIGNSTGGTQTVAATNLVRPSDWNSAHNQFYTLSGNTTNASTASGTDVVFQAAGNLTIAGSTGTIVFSGPQQAVLSYFQNINVMNTVVYTLWGTNSSVLINSFVMPIDGSFSYLRYFVSASHQNSIGAPFNNNSAGSYNSVLGHFETIWANIYSAGTGGSSDSLRLHTQASITYGTQISVLQSASSWTASYLYTQPYVKGLTSSYSETNTFGTAGVNSLPTSNTVGMGPKFLDLPFNASLSAGNYWIVYQRSTSFATAGDFTQNVSIAHVTQNNLTWAPWSRGATSAGDQMYPGMGLWSTNTIGTTTSSIAFSAISWNSSHPIIPFQMIRN